MTEKLFLVPFLFNMCTYVYIASKWNSFLHTLCMCYSHFLFMQSLICNTKIINCVGSTVLKNCILGESAIALLIVKFHIKSKIHFQDFGIWQRKQKRNLILKPEMVTIFIMRDKIVNNEAMKYDIVKDVFVEIYSQIIRSAKEMPKSISICKVLVNNDIYCPEIIATHPFSRIQIEIDVRDQFSFQKETVERKYKRLTKVNVQVCHRKFLRGKLKFSFLSSSNTKIIQEVRHIQNISLNYYSR